MSDLREALQEALSVCQSIRTGRDRRVVNDEGVLFLQTEEWCKWAADEVAPKLRAALAAQAQAEPVGFMNAGQLYELQQGRSPYGYVYPKKDAGASVALYTTPQPAAQAEPVRKPLTDEQITSSLASITHEIPVRLPSGWKKFARAIERAHGITGDKG